MSAPDPILTPFPAQQQVPVLVYTAEQLCMALQIDNVTLWRLEKRGRIRRIPGIGHRRYSITEVMRFVNAA